MEPFQEHTALGLSSLCLERRSRLRRELWQILLVQATRYYGSQTPTQREPLNQYLLTAHYNKIALFVDALSTSMGLGNPSDESEEDFDHRLRMLVSICRANGLYRERHCKLHERNQAACQIEMLSHKTDCEIWSGIRVGDILSALYADGLLEEPDVTNLAGHRLNAARILESLYPLRFFISEFDWKQHFHSRKISPQAGHPQEILNMEVRELIDICKKESSSTLVRADGAHFSMRLVNIKQLQLIGNINIEWTNNLYEHLELSFKDFPVLKLYWFAWASLDIPLAR